MKPQLTNPKTCKQKHTYRTGKAARLAVNRRNATGRVFLRKYRCNVCNYWHVTAQRKVD